MIDANKKNEEKYYLLTTTDSCFVGFMMISVHWKDGDG